MHMRMMSIKSIEICFVNVYNRKFARVLKSCAKVHIYIEKGCGKSLVVVESVEFRCVICIFHTHLLLVFEEICTFVIEKMTQEI